MLDVVDEADQSESEESSEYEEYTDSEDETGPRLKPVFVRKWEIVATCSDLCECHKSSEVNLSENGICHELKIKIPL